MKILKRTISFLCIISVLSSTVIMTSVSVQAQSENNYMTYYISPNGSDDNDGLSMETPFKTIEKARDTLREISNDMDGNIVVNLLGGTYYQNETINFTPEDSGKNGYKIIYQAYDNQEVIISGGTEVTDWVRYDGNIYKANLERDEKLRSLYVDGERKNMTTKTIKPQNVYGTYEIIEGQGDWAWSSGSKPLGMAYGIDDFPDTINPEDIEIEGSTTWNSYVVCVDTVEESDDGKQRIVTLQQPGGAIAQNGASGATFRPEANNIVRNVFEFMDEPGEFYFDKSTHTLYYYAEQDEDLNTKKVIAPNGVETLIDISGTSLDDHVSNLEFTGISFEYSDWNLINIDGSHFKSSPQGANSLVAFSDQWAESKYNILDTLPGAIMMKSCDNITFRRNKISHTGAEGIVMDNDVVDCIVQGNSITDTAGGGIDISHPQHVYVGDGNEHEKYPQGVEGVCKNIVIDNNFIADVSVMFSGNAAVTAYFPEALTFTHNTIKNTPYNGLSLGWGWDRFNGDANSVVPGVPTTTSKNHNISYNTFINTMQKLSDAGPIYTLGAMPDSIIKGNYMTGVPAGDRRYGLHQDEGSAYITISDNVIDTNLYALDSVHVGNWGLQHDLTYFNNYATIGTYYETDIPNSSFEPLKTYPDAFWPDEAYSICVNAGVESEYADIIDNDLLSLADIILPSNIRTNSDELQLKPIYNKNYTVWLAPYDTTDFFECKSMTSAAIDEGSIDIPQFGTEYRLYVVNENGDIVSCSKSAVDKTSVIDITDVTVEMNESDNKMCKSVLLKSNVPDLKGVSFVIGFYDKSNKLVNVYLNNELDFSNNSEIKLDVNTEFPDETSYLKLMLLDGLQNIEPLTTAYVYDDKEMYIVNNEDFSEYNMENGTDITKGSNGTWTTAPGSAINQKFYYYKDSYEETGYAVIGHGNGGNSFFFGCRNDDKKIENSRVYLKTDVRVVSGEATMYLQQAGGYNTYPKSAVVRISPNKNTVSYGDTVLNDVDIEYNKWYTVEYTLDLVNRTNKLSLTDKISGEIIDGVESVLSSVPENVAALAFRKEGSGYEINITNVTLAKLRDEPERMLFDTEFIIKDDDGNPIKNALISVDGNELYTDEKGTATVKLNNGNYSATVSSLGYSTVNDFEFEVCKQSKTVEIVMNKSTEPTNSIEIIVNDTDGKIIDNVDVCVTNIKYGVEIPKSPNGIFNLENGEYLIETEKEGYKKASKVIEVAGSDDSISITMYKAYVFEDFNNITGNWDTKQTGRSCKTEITDGALRFELNTSGTDNPTVTTKTFENVQPSDKLELSFDWKPVIESGKGRSSVLEFKDENDNLIFGLYQDGAKGLNYISADTSNLNGVKFSDYNEDIYKVNSTVDFSKGEVNLVVKNSENETILDELFHTEAKGIRYMTARSVYSLTNIIIDNFGIFEMK